MRRILLVLITSVIGALLVIGCGAGDGSTSGTTDSITKAEFVKQGNAICAGVNDMIDEEFRAFVQKRGSNGNIEKTNPAIVEKEVGRIAGEALEQLIAELRELPVPSGDEDQVALILERQEESAEKIEKDPTFRTSGAPFEELNAPASQYGLVECSV